jgi:membrane-associated phospholipid phosphatase
VPDLTIREIRNDAGPSTPVVVFRGRQASRIAWLGLAGFGAMFAIVRARLSDAFDLALTIKLQRRAHPLTDAVLRVVSWPGFPPQSRIIPSVIAATLFALRLRLEAVCFLFAWGSALISTSVKASMQRPRPVAGRDLRVVAAPLGGSSFPSGHVLTYVGVYGFLAYLWFVFVSNVPARRAGTAGLITVIGLVGPSRIQQGHHWFTDVTASYLLGLSYLIGVAALYRRLKAMRTGTPA